MIGCLLLFSPTEVNPRFYRTHYLVALGLVCLAGIGWSSHGLELSGKSQSLISFLIVARQVIITLAGVLCCIGSVIWSVEGNPGHRFMGIASMLILLVANGVHEAWASKEILSLDLTIAILGNLTSAALLGTTVTAMLLGHFYLIAPGMALAPLLRVLTALFWAVGLRMILAGSGLWSWTRTHSLLNWEDETVLWLPVRWGLGIGGPFVLGWMASSAAKIRSTQSATGILYVVVILSFLGELTSQLLTAYTGYSL
jgi:hypothetical protein